MNLRSTWTAGLVIALILGVAFRLAWPSDIEYKQDEFYTFTRTKKFVEGSDRIPPGEGFSRWLGMPTSKGFQNTGMSLWIFCLIGSLSGAATPPTLARGVQACNVAAIFLLFAFAWRCFKGREREWWLWAVALVCVNPFAVLFERKIWPPSTLPLMMVVFLAAWRYRPTRWGAFWWGLLGIIAGQIHMAGFIYAAAFFLWTALYDRRGVAWGWWLAGNLLGLIPMLPWIYYMAGIPAGAGGHGAPLVAWWRLFSNHFWIDWFSEPFGLGLGYSLGNDFGAFATWGVTLLLAVAILLALRLLSASLLRWWRNKGKWLETWKNDQVMFTSSVLQAGFWFYGILLTVSCIRFERHYLITAFPLPILWAARLALPIGANERQWATGRRILLALCVTNALITFAFLRFLHVNGGAPHGDYGKSYAKQLQAPASRDPATMDP